MTKVAVIRDGHVLETYDINLGGLNYVPSEEELFEIARTQAIDDGLVDETQAGELSFQIMR